ncbi:hypothetical protein AYO49_04010 [Verrucomicrobiaceae bacterium SCGC AG-212-N21]|nr:hypothetical protein AYO49_04010 [Verrucomicrobiaceae bacterium SCGC AG-212-N21]
MALGWMLGAWTAAGSEPFFPGVNAIAEGEVCVRVVLIAADAQEVAQWMLESDGTEGAMEKRLMDETSRGRATEVARVTAGGRPGLIKAEAPKKIRVIWQFDAAHLWQKEWYAKQYGKALADPEKYLEVNRLQGIGAELEADVPIIPDHPGGTVRVKFSYTPEPEERPTTTWPLATLRAPRVILRPWTVNVQCRMPNGKPVLLGAQMEAPTEGKVNTGKVWLALGQLDIARDRLSESGVRKSVPPVIETDAMAWVFSVPNDMAAAWLTKRVDSSSDATTLREWIEASRSRQGVGLAGVMHIRQESGQDSDVVSRRFWDDGSGFEPGAEGPDYRTLPESDEEYELRHEFSTDIAAETASGNDPFAPVAVAASPPSRRIAASVKFVLPPHAARWLRVQSAMERVTGNDPAGMELAAVGHDECQSHAMLRHGDVAVVAAWPQADRTHTRVAFMRVLRSDAAVVASRAGGANPLLNGVGTLWMVDTEVSPWLAQLAPEERMDDTGLAERVIDDLRAGKARLAGVLLRQTGEECHGSGMSAEGEGVLVNYLNTHPYAGGIPFNPRYFRPHGPGMQWSWVTKAEPKGTEMELHLTEATAATQKLRWGVKLAHDEQRTPENSGVDLPVRDEVVVHCKRVVPWNKPVVIAVALHGKGEAVRLRWLIEHYTPTEGFTTESAAKRGRFEAQSYQASLIAVKSTDAAQLPAVVPDIVAMNKAWEAQLLDLMQSGKARLVDFVAMTTDHAASAAVGAVATTDPFLPDSDHATFSTIGAAEVMDYLEPRGVKGPNRVEEYDSVPVEPLPETFYDSQINLREHRNGLKVRWGNKVAVAHGGSFEVLTDTLQGWYEFPTPRTEEEVKAGFKKVMVSVQRPVFTAHRGGVEWPEKGDVMVIPWNGSTPPEGEVWFILLRRQDGEPLAK